MKEIVINNNNMKKQRSMGEFPGVKLDNGWGILETEYRDAISISYSKKFWAFPADKKPSNIMIMCGEWRPEAEQKNKFYVRGSIFTSDYTLFKYMKLESAELKVMEIMERTDKRFEKLYKEWISKYNFDPNKSYIEIESEEDEQPLWH
jgi:hypothetical protein